MRPTPAAPDPAALRGRLGEGRAKNTLPAGLRVIIAGQVSQPLVAQKHAVCAITTLARKVAFNG